MTYLSDEMIEHLKTLARREGLMDQEEFDPHGYSGGNYDDAYYAGYDDGETQIARTILAALHVSWNEGSKWLEKK